MIKWRNIAKSKAELPNNGTKLSLIMYNQYRWEEKVAVVKSWVKYCYY